MKTIIKTLIVPAAALLALSACSSETPSDPAPSPSATNSAAGTVEPRALLTLVGAVDQAQQSPDAAKAKTISELLSGQKGKETAVKGWVFETATDGGKAAPSAGCWVVSNPEKEKSAWITTTSTTGTNQVKQLTEPTCKDGFKDLEKNMTDLTPDQLLAALTSVPEADLTDTGKAVVERYKQQAAAATAQPAPANSVVPEEPQAPAPAPEEAPSTPTAP